MRWSCPHCGANLAVTDEKLGSGWSFSRCYKCGGFALVRKSDVNLIKVDKAPPGEHVLLPEPSEDPVLGQQAADRLEKYVNTKTVPKNVGPMGSAGIMNHVDGKTTFPPPLPDLSELLTSAPARAPRAITRNWTRAILPTAIGIAGFMAAGSGIYIYWKSEALYERARIAAKTEAPRVELSKPAPVSFVESDEVVKAPPMTPAIAAVAPPVSEAKPLTDQVHQNAMAPTRVAAAEPALQPMNALSAPEPIRAPELARAIEPARMKVRARLAAKLHTGPGLEFPVVGVANPEATYPVIDWNNRWFKISFGSDSGEKAKNQAWIRNDLIQLVRD